MSSKWYLYRASAERARLDDNLAEAEKAWLAALEEAEDFGQYSPRLTTTLEGLSEVLWIEGKFELAAPICRRLLRIYELSMGRDHMDVGIIANNLAMLYHRWNKLEEAEMFYERALGIKRRVLGPHHTEVATLMSNYASLLLKRNKIQEARALAARANEINARSWRRSGSWDAFKKQ